MEEREGWMDGGRYGGRRDISLRECRVGEKKEKREKKKCLPLSSANSPGAGGVRLYLPVCLSFCVHA